MKLTSGGKIRSGAKHVMQIDFWFWKYKVVYQQRKKKRKLLVKRFQLKIRSLHLLDNLSNCLMNLKNSVTQRDSNP